VTDTLRECVFRRELGLILVDTFFLSKYKLIANMN